MDVEVRLLYVPSLSRCVFNSFWYTFIVDLRLLPVNKRRFVFSYGATLCDKVPGSRNEGRGRGSRGGGKKGLTVNPGGPPAPCQSQPQLVSGGTADVKQHPLNYRWESCAAQ